LTFQRTLEDSPIRMMMKLTLPQIGRLIFVVFAAFRNRNYLGIVILHYRDNADRAKKYLMQSSVFNASHCYSRNRNSY